MSQTFWIILQTPCNMVLMNNRDTELYQSISMLVQWQLCLFYTTRVQQGIPVKYIKILIWLLHKFSSSQFFLKSVLYIFLWFLLTFSLFFFFQKNTENRIQWHLTGVVIEYPSMMRYISDWIFTDISFGVNLKVTLKVKKKKIRLATVRCMIKTCCFQCPLTQSVIRNWQDQCDFN